MMSDLISSFASFFLIKNIHSIVLVTVYLSSLFSNKKCMLTALIEKSTDFFYEIMYRNMYVEQMNGWDWNICSQSAINGFPSETIVVYNTLLWFLTQFVWYMMIWTSYTFYRHVWDVIIQPCSTLNILCGLFVSVSVIEWDIDRSRGASNITLCYDWILCRRLSVCTIDVSELISKFTSHLLMDVITYPCWDLN